MSGVTRSGSTIQAARITITLDGTAGLGEAATVVPLFTVTGQVFVHIITAFCQTGLGEAAPTATVSLGTTNNVAAFTAATDSVDIDTKEWWVAAAPSTLGSIDPLTTQQGMLVEGTDNIILNPLTQDTNAGVIDFTVLWEPISSGGTIS